MKTVVDYLESAYRRAAEADTTTAGAIDALANAISLLAQRVEELERGNRRRATPTTPTPIRRSWP